MLNCAVNPPTDSRREYGGSLLKGSADCGIVKDPCDDTALNNADDSPGAVSLTSNSPRTCQGRRSRSALRGLYGRVFRRCGADRRGAPGVRKAFRRAALGPSWA